MYESLKSSEFPSFIDARDPPVSHTLDTLLRFARVATPLTDTAAFLRDAPDHQTVSAKEGVAEHAGLAVLPAARGGPHINA